MMKQFECQSRPVDDSWRRIFSRFNQFISIVGHCRSEILILESLTYSFTVEFGDVSRKIRPVILTQTTPGSLYSDHIISVLLSKTVYIFHVPVLIFYHFLWEKPVEIKIVTKWLL